MADIRTTIGIDVDTSGALASIKKLQSDISKLNKDLAQVNADPSNAQNKFLNALNGTSKGISRFSAEIVNVKSSTKAFTDALEGNKISMGQAFKYGISQVKGFRQKYTSEFNTIENVARDRVKSLQTQFIKLGDNANGSIKAISIKPLRLDLNDLGTQMAITSQKQQIMNQLLKQGSTNMLNWGKNTQWAGRQLMVGFTIPLSIFAAKAGQSFAELEDQAIRFKRVYGDLFTLPAEGNAMLKELTALGSELTKYGVAVKDTLSLAADAAAMGKTGAELTAQVAEASRLAILGSVSQQQALETTTSLTNTFGIAADQLASKIDFLNAVENQTVVSIEDLTTAIPKAGPVIQQLGGNVEDLAFFLTAMKEGGINASEGANALKSGIASLINPTGQASDLFMSFGINIRELVSKSGGDVKGMIISVAQALDKLDPAQRAQAIEQMFGKFQFARISTLFSNVIKDGNQASRVLDLMGESTANLASLSSKELKRIEESPLYAFKGAIEQFNAALAPIGESFMKMVTPFIEAGTKVLDWFNNLNDGAKSFATAFVGIIGGIAPIVIMGVGLIANALGQGMKVFQLFYQRITGASKDSLTLGESTAYMSQEMIDASAAASSLDQVHQKLIQRFSLEKESIDLLTRSLKAYRSEIQSLSASPQSRIPADLGRGSGRKMATGGFVSGPGTGTSDSVPIMASNGEFIMPAKQSKKYAGLLKAMISGNLPGFSKGGSVGDSNKVSYNGSEYSVRAGSGAAIEALIVKLERLNNTTTQIDGVLKSFGSDVKLSAKAVLDAATSQDHSLKTKGGASLQAGHLQLPKGINPQTGERIVGSLTRAMVPGQNKALDQGGQTKEQFSKDWNSVQNGLIDTVSLGGVEITDAIRKAADQVDREIHDIAIEIADGAKITDEILSKATDRVISTNKKAGGDKAKVAGALEKTKNIDVVARAKTEDLKNSKAVKAAGHELGDATYDEIVRKLKTSGDLEEYVTKGGRKALRTTEKGSGLTIQGKAGVPFARQNRKGSYVPEGRYAVTPGSKTYLDKAGDKGSATLKSSASKVIDDFGKELKTAAEVKSPSKKTAKAAKGMVDGVVETIKDGKNDVKKAAEEATKPLSGKASRRASGNSKSIGSSSGRFLQDPKSGNVVSTEKYDKQQASRQEAVARSQNIAVANVSSKMQGLGTKVLALSGIISTASMVASGFGVDLGAAGDMIFQLSNSMFMLSGIFQGLISATMKQKMASSILSRATMAGGTSLKGILGNGGLLSKLGNGFKFVGKFLGPVGIALSTLAVVVPFLVKVYNDQKAKMEAFGNIIKVTGDQIKFLGDNAGQAVTTDTGFNTSVLGAATGADTKAVTDYTKNEEFLTQFKTQIDAAKVGAASAVEDALKLLSYNLSSSGLSDDIVTNVISAIAIAADRTDLNLDFNVKATPQTAQNFIKDIKSKLGTIDANLQGNKIPLSTGGYAYDRSQGTAQMYDIGVPSDYSNADLEKIKEQGQAAATVMESLAKQLSSGAIDAETFNSQMDELNSVLNSISDNSAKEAFANGILANIDDEGLRNAALGLKDFEKKMALAKLVASGMVPITQDVIDKLNSEANAQAYVTSLIDDAIVAKKELDVVNTSSAADAAIAGINAQSVAIQGQIDGYNNLVAAGADGALAYKVVGDAALYTAYQTAVAAGKTAEFITEMENLAGLQSKLDGFAPGSSSGGGAAKTTPLQDAIDQLKKQKTAILEASSAYNKLRDAGLSIGKAFDIAKDPVLATALATTKVGTSAWKKLLDLIKQTNKEVAKGYIKDLVRQNQGMIDLMNDQTAVSSALTDLGYSYEFIQKVLSDDTLTQQLATDLKDGTLNAKNLKRVLEQIKAMDAIQVKINFTTKEGTAEEFQKLYDKAIGYLEAQKATIRAKFDIQVEADSAVVAEAESKIAGINDQVGKYEAGLQEITWQEDEVNKKYDDRIAALDKVQKVNERIAATQKTQLTLSDALANGDLAAAAKAMQDQREQDAAAAVQTQKDILEAGRTNALSQLTSTDGSTRKDLEASILDLKKQIFDIEENTLKPAQQRIRLAQEESDLQTAALDTQINKWELLAAQVNEAKLKLTDEEMKALLDQATIIKDMLQNWDDIKDKTATLTVKKVEDSTSSSGKTANGSTSGSSSSNGSTDSRNLSNIAGITPGELQALPIGPASPTNGQSVSGYIKSTDSAAAAAAVKALASTVSSTAGKIAGVVSSAGKLTTTADTAAKKITSGAVTVASNLIKAGSLVNKTSSSAGEANRFANSMPKPKTQTKTISGGRGIIGLSTGGMVPKYFAAGGFARGTDTVPAMLTPGEFVVKRQAVQKFGADKLKTINSGAKSGDSVYNYSLSVNVKSESNPEQIARTVMSHIKQVDSQRIRGVRI